MTCYPVYIPTLNRYEHFKNCVESLAKCTHADKTELVVGLDYPPSEKYVDGWKKVKAYLPTLHTLGFGKVTIFEHDHNLGPYENATFLWNYCADHYDACIVSEDDNVFSPAFLDFVDRALEKHAHDDRIASVCGFTHAQSEIHGLPGSFLTEDCCAWGMGMWISKHRRAFAQYLQTSWQKELLHRPGFVFRFVLTYPIGFVMFFGMVKSGKRYGDICRTAYNFANHTYQLRPAKSLVRNCGNDGSGANCGIIESIAKQEISTDTTFDFGDKPPRVRHTGLFWQGWEGTRYAKFMPWIKR